MASVSTVKMLINGNFVESDTPHFEDVVNPATQEVLARVPFSAQDEIEPAVSAAREAFQTKGNFLGPTIFSAVTPDMEVYTD